MTAFPLSDVLQQKKKKLSSVITSGNVSVISFFFSFFGRFISTAILLSLFLQSFLFFFYFQTYYLPRLLEALHLPPFCRQLLAQLRLSTVLNSNNNIAVISSISCNTRQFLILLLHPLTCNWAKTFSILFCNVCIFPKICHNTFSCKGFSISGFFL